MLLWSGIDPQKHEEVTGILDHNKIPERTVLRDDHLVSPSMQPAFKVYVPKSLASKANEFLQQDPLLGVDENAPMDGSEIMELPAEEYDPAEGDLREPRTNWHPEDATAEIWSGDAPDLADMIAASLRENQIQTRRNDDVEGEDFETPAVVVPPYKLFVLPEDESRALEIVHEIIDAEPPE